MLEALIERLNARHNQKLEIMKGVGANTFTENGNYFIKGRTLYKESFINGFKEKNKVATFTKNTAKKLIENLLKNTFNAMAYYQKGVLVVVESPTEGKWSYTVDTNNANTIIENFNYDNRMNDRYAIAWGRV